MIPSHLKLARRVEELLHELAPDAKTDRDFADLFAPHVLGLLAEQLGPFLVARLSRDLLELAEKAVASRGPEATPCWRISVCARSAVNLRLDPNGSGIWHPVCPDHLKGALPMEIRPLVPR